MDEPITLQDILDAIDPALLCAQCPLALIAGGGIGQESVQAQARDEGQLDRQMTLPFEEEFTVDPEPPPDPLRPLHTALQQVILTYLLQEQMELANEAEEATSAEAAEKQKEEVTAPPPVRPAGEGAWLPADTAMFGQGRAPKETDNHRALHHAHTSPTPAQRGPDSDHQIER